MKKPKQSKVGYGKPPIGKRWQKGQSGNPKGRPPQNTSSLFSEGVVKKQMQEIMQKLITCEVKEFRSLERNVKHYPALEAMAIRWFSSLMKSGDMKELTKLVDFVDWRFLYREEGERDADETGNNR